MKVNILGTKYKIIDRTETDDPKLRENDGYCDSSTKEIVLLIYSEDVMNKGDMEKFRKLVLRHEIIHAFLCESGLEASASVSITGWAQNEEMVDWIAIQSPKLYKAFKEVGCL